MGKAVKDLKRKEWLPVPLRNIRFLVSLFFGLNVFAYNMISCSQSGHREFFATPGTIPVATDIVKIDASLDFSVFKHQNEQHEKLPCSYCHVREDNSAVPKFAGHQQCAGCHVEQFEDKKSSICAVCHTDSESGAMKRFPALRNFGARFDHARHTRTANCAQCHRPSNGGKAYSILGSSNSHAACFQCHTPDKQVSGKDIGSCATCHQTGRPPRAVSESAVAFSKGFSHKDHGMTCTACHTVKAGTGRGNQVASIALKMHFPAARAKSCGTCHNNKTAFGGDDFKDCKRCHTGSRFDFP